MSWILAFRINIGFRLLDLVDRDIWNVTNNGWYKTKYIMYALSGPIEIFNDFVEVVAGKCNLSLRKYFNKKYFQLNVHYRYLGKIANS